MKKLFPASLFFSLIACVPEEGKIGTIMPSLPQKIPFQWNAATVYFLLTDRFFDVNDEKKIHLGRTKESDLLRGFMGGSLKGVTQKLKEGYFKELGVDAIWFTPIVEQIHGQVDEGSGKTYPFHGYWIKDWTQMDPNFGTKEDLHELVQEAHKQGIRILLDAVVNHIGPITDKDPIWPDTWVRTGPTCTYQDYESTVSCTLVDNLPDILTESNENVELPPVLVDKWKKEGRYEQEIAELDQYFEKTGHPRAPRFYIMKWLTDYIREFGIDGYRVDTVKHTEEFVWAEFRRECDLAWADWRAAHPDQVLDDAPFFLVGEVYNYTIGGGRWFDFGDHRVDYFEQGFNSLINFEFKWNARESFQNLFDYYSKKLYGELEGVTVMNYISSHDDSEPLDKGRKIPKEAATKLLLCPGIAQIYYGDESARPLEVRGAKGDANLRSVMNWDQIETDKKTKEILDHWSRLGRFRSRHPAVGAGRHEIISKDPYIFRRVLEHEDQVDVVVVGLDLKGKNKILDLKGAFPDGTNLHDAYSGKKVTVENGNVNIISPYDIVLLEVQEDSN